MYLWFNKMEWFFKENTKEGKDVKPVWENIADIDLVGMSWGYLWMFIFFILFFVMFSVGFPLFSFIAVLWCVFSCLSYKSIMNGVNIGVGKVTADVFKYYKSFIIAIISYYVIKSVFANFGNFIGGICIAAFVVCVAFIAKKYFESEVLKNVSEISSYKQATKICKGGEFTLSSSLKNVVNRAVKNVSSLKKLAALSGHKLPKMPEIHKKMTDKLKVPEIPNK
jgi:hypothetical protein